MSKVMFKGVRRANYGLIPSEQEKKERIIMLRYSLLSLVDALVVIFTLGKYTSDFGPNFLFNEDLS